MNADEKVFGVLPLSLPLVCVGTNNSYALKREKSYKSKLTPFVRTLYSVINCNRSHSVAESSVNMQNNSYAPKGLEKSK